MADLSVKVAGVSFHNPLIAASGTFGFGREYREFYPLSVLGGISCKGNPIVLWVTNNKPSQLIITIVSKTKKQNRLCFRTFIRRQT